MIIIIIIIITRRTFSTFKILCSVDNYTVTLIFYEFPIEFPSPPDLNLVMNFDSNASHFQHIRTYVLIACKRYR